MALGKFKPVTFDPYGRRRHWRPPRWLVLLVGGIAIGAAGVIIVQERYLPPRLSAAESAQIRSEFAQADAERVRLKSELAEATRQLDQARADVKGLNDELASSRATAGRLADDLAFAVASLPPDPRGGTIAVRAGRFSTQRGMLVYDVVLTRETESRRPMSGVMQVTVAGQSAAGTDTAVALKPVSVSIGTHEIVRGSLALPDGFKPRQATIQVLDRIAGNSLGMRVMLVK